MQLPGPLLSPSFKNIKNFLYFLKKSFSYISGKWDSYISGNGNFKSKLKKKKKKNKEKKRKKSAPPKNSYVSGNVFFLL